MAKQKKEIKVFDNENETPEVGLFYYVRCAVFNEGYPKKEIAYPIIGIAHNDKQFGLDALHYHIDGRFTNMSVDEEGRTNTILVVEADKTSWGVTYKGIEIKRRKCRRLTTGLIPKEAYVKPREGNPKFYYWYQGMIGKSCKGKRCPHLGTTMTEVNGRLECPLHRLQGSIENEIIIPYK